MEFRSLAKTALAAAVAYSSHYGITKFYSSVCLPTGVVGFFKGAVTTGSPMCSTAFGMMQQSQVTYSTILLTSLSHLFVDVMSHYFGQKGHQEEPKQD
jgi:hypothetical protein